MGPYEIPRNGACLGVALASQRDDLIWSRLHRLVPWLVSVEARALDHVVANAGGAAVVRLAVDVAGVPVVLKAVGYSPSAVETIHQLGIDSTLNLCIPSCEPLLQDCLGTGDACYANDFYFICHQDTSGEEGQANDPCGVLSDCDPGLQCTLEAFVGMGCAPGSLACCTPFCQFPGGACPNPDQQCLQYLDPMQPLPDDPELDVGLCGVPG